jgi:hypothetical protein
VICYVKSISAEVWRVGSLCEPRDSAKLRVLYSTDVTYARLDVIVGSVVCHTNCLIVVVKCP